MKTADMVRIQVLLYKLHMYTMPYSKTAFVLTESCPQYRKIILAIAGSSVAAIQSISTLTLFIKKPWVL